MGVVDEILRIDAETRELLHSPVASRLECGLDVRNWLMGLPPGPAAASFMGVAVYLDPAMAPNEWKMLDREGNVLARSTDPATPVQR